MKAKITWFPWLIVFYEVAIYLSMDSYVPAMHSIARDFSVSNHLVQLSATAWMLGGLSVLLFVGPLSDRWGRRPMLLGGGVIYVLSCIGCAAAANIHTLLLFRFIQGFAMPTMVVSGYAVVNEYYESQQAIHVLSMMSAIKILAPAFGPFLGGLILLGLSWHWIFILLAVWSVIALVLLFFHMPETVDHRQVAAFSIKAVLRSYLSLLLNGRFLNCSLVTVLPIVGLMVWLLSGAFAVHHFHFSTLDFGLMQIAIFGSYMMGNTLVKRFSKANNNHRFVKWGMCVALIGAAVNVLCSVLFPQQLLLFVVVMMVTELGCGLFMPILGRQSLEQSDAPMGIRVGVFTFLRIGAGALGSFAVVWFYNNTLISISAVILAFIAVPILLMLSRCRYLILPASVQS
jgi:multidrug resistance protein